MVDYTGTPGDDFYQGTAAADFLKGLGGDDQLLGEGGADRVRGYDGDDFLRGGEGNDLLYGDAGFDFLYGDDGNDRMFGGLDDDFMRGGRGVDYFDGGDGNDRISFFEFTATQGVIADLRTQTISNDGFGNAETMVSIEGLGGGTVFTDLFYGNDVNNVLIADRTDTVLAFDGDDFVQFGSVEGATIDGGAGVDTFVLSLVTYRLGASGSVIDAGATKGVIVDLTRQRVIDDGFGFGARLTGFEAVEGSRFADTLTGDAAANRLTGQDGADRLFGRDGDDFLMGGTGADLLNGDTGIDILIGGDDADRLFGGADADLLDGGAANDQLFGEAGDDAMVGGFGIDAMTGGAGADSFIFRTGDTGITRATADRILDFTQGAPGIGDRLDLAQIDAIAGGTDDAFTFIGTAAFSGAAGEVRYQVLSGTTYVYATTDAVAGIDLVIRLDGALTLTAADFVL